MQLSDFAKTFLLVAVFLLVITLKHAGFMVLLMIPFFAVSLIRGIVLMVRKPDQRKLCGARMVILAAALCTIASVHWYWFHAARDNANAVATAVIAYKSRTGAYPTGLAELGLNQNELLRKWMLGYGLDRGQPSLFYATTFTHLRITPSTLRPGSGDTTLISSPSAAWRVTRQTASPTRSTTRSEPFYGHPLSADLVSKLLRFICQIKKR
jgi:hypothetical protein